MRFNYKVVPVTGRVLPHVTSDWLPFLPIRLSYKHSRLTPIIEAIVDSGAPACLLRFDIANYIGINPRNGDKGAMGGVVAGQMMDVYYHQVFLHVATEKISITAGFAERLSVAALLGRNGFFEHFSVSFDPAGTPPGLDIQRVGRA